MRRPLITPSHPRPPMPTPVSPTTYAGTGNDAAATPPRDRLGDGRSATRSDGPVLPLRHGLAPLAALSDPDRATVLAAHPPPELRQG